MTVTLTKFPRAVIHQLTGGEAWPSGLFPGDFVDVIASLGHIGRSILIDSTYGEASIRINVTEKVFGRHEPVELNNPYIPYAEFYDRPVSSGIFEREGSTISVLSGIPLAIEDIQLKDFKVVTLDSGVKITFF